MFDQQLEILKKFAEFYILALSETIYSQISADALDVFCHIYAVGFFQSLLALKFKRNKADCHKLRAQSQQRPTDKPTDQPTNQQTKGWTKRLIELRACDQKIQMYRVGQKKNLYRKKLCKKLMVFCFQFYH